MKTDKDFPNGFDSWIETYYEAVTAITLLINTTFGNKYHSPAVAKRLAIELTDEFENLRKDKKQDNKFQDNINKIKKEYDLRD